MKTKSELIYENHKIRKIIYQYVDKGRISDLGNDNKSKLYKGILSPDAELV